MQITIQNLSKELHGISVLHNINLCLESGTVYGLHGINGSGKTMLMRAICGLIRPTAGTVSIDGQVLGKDIDFPASIGILLENPSFLPSLTGRANLRLLAEMQGHITDTCLDHTLSTVGLDGNDKRKYRKYSLGMKQRLGIAAAILNDPDMIILDEPLNALDTEGVAMVHDIINAGRERGAIILLACHNREELDALADELILIENGQITSPQKLQ